MIDPTEYSSWNAWVAEFSDPQAALLAGVFLATGLAGTTLVSRLAQGTKSRQVTASDDPFVVAYAAGGPKQVALVALSTLSAHGLVEPSAANGTFRATPAVVPPSNLPHIEHIVLTACKANSQSVGSLILNSDFSQAIGAMEKEAVASGLLRRKTSAAMRTLASLPFWVGAAFAGSYTYAELKRGDFNLLMMVATAVLVGFGIRTIIRKRPVEKRQLISTKVSDHPELNTLATVHGHPSAETYESLKTSAVPVVIGLSGIAAASHYCGFWNASDQELFASAEKALSTHLGSQSSAAAGYGGGCGSFSSDSSGSDSGGGCGGGCGGA